MTATHVRPRQAFPRSQVFPRSRSPVRSAPDRRDEGAERLASFLGWFSIGLGVTSLNRTPLMPDMPAISEELPGFDVNVWSGLVVPTGTPKEVIDRLWDASRKALATPEVGKSLNALGLDVTPMGPDEFGRFITAETAKWARQVKAAGIQPE